MVKGRVWGTYARGTTLLLSLLYLNIPNFAFIPCMSVLIFRLWIKLWSWEKKVIFSFWYSPGSLQLTLPYVGSRPFASSQRFTNTDHGGGFGFLATRNSHKESDQESVEVIEGIVPNLVHSVGSLQLTLPSVARS